MDSDKKPEEKTATPADSADKKPETDVPATPGEETLDATHPMSAAGSAADSGDDKKKTEAEPAKPQSGLKQALKKFRLYVLLILLIAVVGGVFVIVSSLNGRKTPPAPSYEGQTLTQSELKQLASSNTTVGSSGQTLNVQGNADLTGNGVVKGNLNVAGTIQSGSQFTLSQVKVSGNTSLASAQINSLQVSSSAAFQSQATFDGGMNVAGNISFTSLDAASLTDTNIDLTSNGAIEGHVSFAPPANATPYRQISFGVLGNGGSASVFGTDTSGTVSINTGNNPLPGCFITIIFNTPYTNMPNVLISPVGYGAGASKYYTITTLTSYKICTDNAAPANQAFAFDYFTGATPD